MPVITIAQSKGGAGKSTLALALASEFADAGGTVAILDADRQLSLMKWYQTREDEKRNDPRIQVIDVSKITDDKIGDAIADARSKATLVIVDSEGTANMKTAYAAQDSDFVAVPCRPTVFDLERTVETRVMLDRMCPGVPYRVILAQTKFVARSNTEMELEKQINDNFPTFDDCFSSLDAFSALANWRRTLPEIEQEGLAKTERARIIAKSILRQALEDIQNTEKDAA